MSAFRYPQADQARDKHPWTEKTIDLDQRRGMAAQKATDLRRLRADVEANEKALRLRQDELEGHLLAPRSGYDSRAWRRGAEQIPVNRQIVSRHAARREPLFKALSDHRT